MGASRLNLLIQTLQTRRAALGLGAGIAALLGFDPGADASARCKKKCGPCQRCRQGKCRPKPGTPRCGPCSSCDKGKCNARCSPDRCSGSGKDEICLRDCDPPCNTCSRCDPVRGACEALCDSQFCDGGFCRIPCDPPCGECAACDFGECVAFCPDDQCVNGRCQIDCDPDCAADERCIAGTCYPACDPPCGAGEGCVAGTSGNSCIELAGNCHAAADFCGTGQSVACTVNGRSGSCDKTPDGKSVCRSMLSCTACASDADCQDQGFGANSRCITDCIFCAGAGCAVFAGG